MTEAYAAAGRLGLSADEVLAAGDPSSVCEAALVDRLIDLLMALEPFEIKQSVVPLEQAAGPASAQGAGEGAGDAAAGGEIDAPMTAPGAQNGAALDAVVAAAGAADAGPQPEDHAAKLSVESTRAMLARMRTVLDREAARLGEDGLEGKAAVDQVALIARTLEKIDQMERLIAEDQARAAGGRLGPQEREQLRQTVRQLILAAAERLAVERAAGPEEAGEAAELGEVAECGEGAVAMSGGEDVAEDFSDRTDAETR
ncbi:hypothetical protein [Hoeflea alexandrii]|uniref:hypothetical protein n=1 Tax=Hoeflea alexandrii TaxID=288436 RepID=UPI0022AFD869|nr:hypothetical protein [Hoeflea alexandrii]MCZ4288037.1 hypothetical protein [Hoeflea alexandrii]